MRFMTDGLLALAAFGLLLGGLSAADSFELPPLPPPPPAASGGSTTSFETPAAPAVPASPAAPASSATTGTGVAPVSPDSTLLPPPPPPPAVTPAPSATTTPAVSGDWGTGFLPAGAPAPASGGVEGKITGGRVNVRAGQGTNFEIVLTASADTPVSVFKRAGEWVQIGYPASESCYIDIQSIGGGVPAEIPEQGLVRNIQGKDVSVRARPWPGSTVVGQVNEGETVVVTGLRGQWAKIRPPQSARAWVFYKYVSYDRTGVEETGEIVAAGPTSGEGAASSETSSGRGGVTIPRKDGEDPVLAGVRKRAEFERQQREQNRQATQNIMSSLDQQLAQIEEESAQRIRRVYEEREQQRRMQAERAQALAENYVPGAPPGSLGGRAEGWVQFVGRVGGRPAAYRLVKGGETLYLMRSTAYNLDSFIGKRVLVSGAIQAAPAWEADIMDVATLSFFETPNSVVERTGSVRPVTPVPDAPAARARSGQVEVDITGLEGGMY